MSNDPTREVLDNVDLDLTGVPLSKPIIDKQWVLSVVRNCFWERKTTKAGEDAKQLVIELVTQEPTTSTTGREVPPGHEVETNIWGTPSGGLTQLMINQKIGRFQTAALGIPEAKAFKPEEQVGKLVKAYYEAEASRQDSSMLFQRVSRWERAG